MEAEEQSESEEKAFSADPTREEAGEELASLLLRLKQMGKLSAKEVCVVAWWASRAGACGPVPTGFPTWPAQHRQVVANDGMTTLWADRL